MLRGWRLSMSKSTHKAWCGAKLSLDHCRSAPVIPNAERPDQAVISVIVNMRLNPRRFLSMARMKCLGRSIPLDPIEVLEAIPFIAGLSLATLCLARLASLVSVNKRDGRVSVSFPSLIVLATHPAPAAAIGRERIAAFNTAWFSEFSHHRTSYVRFRLEPSWCFQHLGGSLILGQTSNKINLVLT